MDQQTVLILLVAMGVLALIACVFAAIAAFRRIPDHTGDLRESMQQAQAQNDRIERQLRDESERSREAVERQNTANREELAARIDMFRTGMDGRFNTFTESQQNLLEGLYRRVDDLSVRNEQRIEKLREGTQESILQMQQGNEKRLQDMEAGIGKLREGVEQRLLLLQQGNEKKLDEMRGVVDEKLTRTLEERLGSSFKLVSDQLEQVYKNLGEMKSLSRDMGDIKNIFNNVKTRGTWGEAQLGALLEQMLTPDQYAANVKVRPRSNEIVEFAIKLPGPGDGKTPVWLPIDSKFPMEDYLRLQEAMERSDAEGMNAASRALEQRVISQARDIHNKYIAPPNTTDFAILFVPAESVFAEVLRRSGLSERLQREYRVTVAGPTTLAALLNSLRMGFKTLAIQKRSGEVWELLGAVKKQFGRFADTLESVQRHLDRASTTVRDASHVTNQIQKRLDRVEELPEGEATRLLPLRTLETPAEE